MGRLAPNKNLPVLVEAVARLRDLAPAVHAVIIGDTSDIYADEMRRCRHLARQLGIENRVHFLGSVTEDRLADCYRDADLLVIPSEHEGFCIPVLEAQACGLPVIAARATALPETVGGAGLTFTAGEVDDLAGQVRRSCGPALQSRPTMPAPRAQSPSSASASATRSWAGRKRRCAKSRLRSKAAAKAWKCSRPAPAQKRLGQRIARDDDPAGWTRRASLSPRPA